MYQYTVIYSTEYKPDLTKVNEMAVGGWELLHVLQNNKVAGTKLQWAYFLRKTETSSNADTLIGTFTVGVSTNQIILPSHGLVNGTQVRFALGTEPVNTLPAPLVVGTYYYVVGARGGDFQVSTTLNGTVIDITTSGVGGTNEVWKKA